MEILALILIVLGYLFKSKLSQIKGNIGEEKVKIELNKLGKNYLILNDIMIYSDNKTHQIDHLVISDYGIFVIEMKNYSGTIIGKENEKTWTQKIGKQTNKLNNPIIQNHGHILALKDITKEKEKNFISIVCFGNQVTLKVNESNVVKLKELNKKIKSYKTVKLNNKKELYNIIMNSNITDKNERKKHVKTIKQQH